MDGLSSLNGLEKSLSPFMNSILHSIIVLS